MGSLEVGLQFISLFVHPSEMLDALIPPFRCAASCAAMRLPRTVERERLLAVLTLRHLGERAVESEELATQPMIEFLGSE
jgi:hypothetical protein